MGSDQKELTGPDLTEGLDPESIAEGQILLGHADGEAVVVARSNGALFVVGASCTHYGGPLAEGIVVDGTIRCPWHHAAFDLATGRVARAPALHDLPCWKITEQGGKATVARKASADSASARRDSQASHGRTVVIVGAGAAGTFAAVTLRREGFEGTIALVEAGEAAPVDRPNLSKDYLAGNAPEEWLPLYPDSFYEENRIELELGNPVASIDTGSREVVFANGSRKKFDTLLIATGAEPIRLDYPEAGQTVHYLRTLADSRAIIERAKTAKKAVVIGASFIGLEVASSLHARGLDVTVVAPETLPLERILGPELGRFIQGVHEANEVKFRLGQTVKTVGESEVVTSGGETIPADLVVAGVGVRPRIALAEAAGIAVDKGVLVDEFLETSIPGIYAAGDIARWPDPLTGQRIRVEHWVVAERQAQCAARNMARGGRDERERFDAVPFFWSWHHDVSIAYVGHAANWDAVEISGSLEERDAVVRFRSGGRVLATATISRDRDSLEAEVAMERPA